MTAENGINDAEWHSDPDYLRYRTLNARRGRTLPHDSIFYRTVHDVPPVQRSEDILDWCMDNWERPYVNVGVKGWTVHDGAADSPTDPNKPSPAWYLDQGPTVPVKRNMEMSNPSNLYLSTSPWKSAWAGLYYYIYVTDYCPDRSERRVKEGHARSQYNVLNDTSKPFHPTDGDRPMLTLWPTLQMSTETTNTEWSAPISGRHTRLGQYTQRSYNSNDWPYFWDPRKPGNKGNYAGASSANVPLPSLLVTYEELARGWVNHTIMMAVQSYGSGGSPLNQAGYGHWPSIQSDGLDAFAPGALDAGGPFGGHIFRLKASFDINGFTDNPMKRTLMRGMRDHGMILMDRHGSSFAGGERDQGENRPVNVLVADHAKFEAHPEWDDPTMQFGEGIRGTGQVSDYTPGAMSPLTLDPGALPMSKEYWDVISLRDYQNLIPGRSKSTTYPDFDQYAEFDVEGNPIPVPVVNQDHWQCILPGT